MDSYYLNKDHWESFADLMLVNAAKPMADISSAVKTAFTRMYINRFTLFSYNSSNHNLKIAPEVGVTKKKRAVSDAIKISELPDVEDVIDDDLVKEDEDDDITEEIAQLKIPKKRVAPKSAEKSVAKRGRGRGK